MTYSTAFKAKMVQKMTGPSALSANDLAGQEGIHQTTLSRWLREAGKVEGMGKSTTKPKRPQDLPAEEKLEVVLEAASLPESELGGFLRRRGLHQAQLERWREQMLGGLEATRAKGTPEKRQIRMLERELQLKEKALAEACALLLLQKKARAIWGAEDDATAARSER